MISGPQIRAARALLGWTARDLALRAVVSISTVYLIEDATGLPSTTVKQVAAVQAALETAGIEFLEGDASGVRLRALALMNNACKTGRHSWCAPERSSALHIRLG
jgi:transcriptional regulator with XRE-family HTH domain